jgi:hypothetical protein
MSKEAMKLALEALKKVMHVYQGMNMPCVVEGVIALESALAKQEQGEPAFHGFMDKNDCCVHICYTPWAAGGPNNELPTAYYTTPQQRKPLTDADYVNACMSYRHDFGLMAQDQRDKLLFTAKEWARAFGMNEAAHGIAPQGSGKK